MGIVWTSKTKTGRVVYDRKPHFFTVRDVTRCLDSVLAEMVGTTAIGNLLEKVSVSLLDKILALVGLSDFAKIVYTWLLNVVGRIIDQLGFNLGLEMSRRLYQKMLYYYDADALKMPPVSQV